MLCIGVNISPILSFPLVGNPSGVMTSTARYSGAKKDSGQAGMTEISNLSLPLFFKTTYHYLYPVIHRISVL
jgi:hypothetical protein